MIACPEIKTSMIDYIGEVNFTNNVFEASVKRRLIPSLDAIIFFGYQNFTFVHNVWSVFNNFLGKPNIVVAIHLSPICQTSKGTHNTFFENNILKGIETDQ